MKRHQLIKEVFIHSLLSLEDAGGGNIPRTQMSKTVLRFFCCFDLSPLHKGQAASGRTLPSCQKVRFLKGGRGGLVVGLTGERRNFLGGVRRT